MPVTINGTTGVDQIQNGTVTIPKISATGSPGNTTFLRGDGAWATAGSPPGTLELLREDIFTTSGTWTKATGYDADDTVMIFLVGGGGSGAASRGSSVNPHSAVSGGGAGFCLILSGRYGDVPTSSWSLTAGAGAPSVSATFNNQVVNGNQGGATTLINTTTLQRFSATGGTEGRGSNAQSSVTLFRYSNEFGAASTNSTVLMLGFSGSSDSPNNYETGSDYLANVSYIPASSGATAISLQGHGGVRSSAERETNDVRFMYPSLQIFGSGGGAGRQGATNRSSWNPKVPALFNTGGDGSGTANGQNATGIGGGGGACNRPEGTTAVSGAGFAGGMVVRYYRGRVSPWQVITAVGA
jgi:hypothetical protein